MKKTGYHKIAKEKEKVKQSVTPDQPKCEFTIQYQEKEYTQSALMEAVKTDWKENRQSVQKEEIKKMALYFKPEERKIYYVVNEVYTGSIELSDR